MSQSDDLTQRIAFQLYNLSWRIALPWLRRNHRLAEGYRQRTLKINLPAADLWIQAASVGESYLALEIIKTLRLTTAIKILLTSNTRQGVDILQEFSTDHEEHNAQLQVSVGYFPFDKPTIMQKAIDNIRPGAMVLLETEIWPGLLRALKEYKCKILIVNGRLTEKSLKRYLLWPALWQQLSPDRVMAISPNDADRFRRLFGHDRIEVMPNIKFDRIASATGSNRDQTTIKAIVPGDNPFVVLASVRRPEEPLVKKIIHKVLSSRPETVIGLFPRHMHRIQYWHQTLNRTGIRNSLRSKTKEQVAAGTVVVWDTFGELLPAYRLAESAFVGGSLAPLGGQNFLEALISGIIPIIGPWWDNFSWVGPEITESGLLRVAGDWEQVADLLLKDLVSAPSRKEVISAAVQFIEARRGGTDRACRRIVACLESK
ncbi:MAG: 3-deoxy-D-manno-octulosonic acid transferase [Deltaproteobacteria bacterium]|nr:3-deoxy-D-manno-octulosonic acid transferase [Deltaproteobacteria bacterium]